MSSFFFNFEIRDRQSDDLATEIINDDNSKHAIWPTWKQFRG
jgi:hypothetical protein